MFLRLRPLYRRYVLHHLRVPLGAVRFVGHPEMTLWLRQGRVCIDAGDVVLEHGGARSETGSLPFAPGAETRVSLRKQPLEAEILPALPLPRLIRAHAALWPRLCLRALKVLPLLPRSRDPHIRARAVRRLGLASDPPAPPLHLPPERASLRSLATPIALILPVHNATHHVTRCLARIDRTTDLLWQLVIVEDGSTDPSLRPMLERWVAARQSATLIRHDRPKGFAGSVNAALDQLGGFDGPVVLLNSDITLPDGWASRLVAPILADGLVASVTPLSNEGELMSVPHMSTGVALRNGEVDAVDAALAPYARHSCLPALPTGTGFCMALSPHWLAEVPRFDESFGRGYGEEVDWCQRTRALGGQHVCQTGLFVGHVGAASFGRRARQDLRVRAGRILSQRWPRFDTDVAQTLSCDPLAGDRLRAGLIWAKIRCKGALLPVYLAHSLGGGTERWLAQRLASHDLAVVLRVGGPLRWQLELHSPAGVTRGATDRFADILQLIRLGGPRDVAYVCGVGDPAPEGLPFRLLDLCAGGQGLEILFHDYFPVNRDYTFRSEAEADWQALWRPALDRAEHLTVFSEASRHIVAACHPDLAHKIRLRPHGPLGPVPPLTPAPAGRPVIGVPGNLNAQKGAQVVTDLARVFARTGEARIVVLGEVAPDCALPRSVTVLGGYRLDDLPHLVARHGIGGWLIPSLWPETFSYVTQESLATGLPCLGFDLGGQGDALRAAENGQVVALRKDGSADLDRLLAALRGLPDWPAIREDTGSVSPRPLFWRRAGA